VVAEYYGLTEADILGRSRAAKVAEPRQVVMYLLREETGIELWALGEVEYYLGKRWDETDIYGADDRGYHATSPFVFGEELRREAASSIIVPEGGAGPLGGPGGPGGLPGGGKIQMP
jgi:hypothetical protein